MELISLPFPSIDQPRGPSAQLKDQIFKLTELKTVPENTGIRTFENRSSILPIANMIPGARTTRNAKMTCGRNRHRAMLDGVTKKRPSQSICLILCFFFEGSSSN